MVRCWCKNTPLCAICVLMMFRGGRRSCRVWQRRRSIGFEILLPFSCLVRVLHLGYYMTSKWAKGASGGQALWFFFLQHLGTFLSLPLFFFFACSSEDSSLCEAQAMIQKEQHCCMMIFYSELFSKREDA
ncbi:hypothetical protein V8C34DRAFT_44186 [Trichoderma compactum]